VISRLGPGLVNIVDCRTKRVSTALGACHVGQLGWFLLFLGCGHLGW